MVIVVILASVSGWYYTRPSVAKGKPILISGALPLTGPLAKNSERIRMGYRDWVDYTNAHGGLLGRPVKLKIYDDEASISKGIELAEKAITVDHCDFLLPWYEGHVGRAVMGVAEKHKMLYTGMGGHMKSFHQGYKYVASFPPLMGEWWASGVGGLLNSLSEDKKPKKAFIASARLTIFEACSESIYEELKKAEIPYVEEWYDLPLKMADPLIMKAKDEGADFLMLNGLLPDGVLLVRTTKKLGYHPRLIWQSVGSPDPSWIKSLGDEGDLTITGAIWMPMLPYKRNDLIKKIWKKKHADEFGEQTLMYYGLGWCWMTTLERGVEGANSTDQEAVRDWLHNNVIHNPAGDIRLNEYGYPETPVNYIVQWQSGKLEIVWPPDVATSEFKLRH